MNRRPYIIAQISIKFIIKEFLPSLLLIDFILGAPNVSCDELDFTLFCLLNKSLFLKSLFFTLLK